MENMENLENTEIVEPAENAEIAEPAKKEKKPFTWKRFLYFALLVTFAAVFIFSGIYVARYFVQSERVSNEYDDLGAMLESLRAQYGSDALPPVPTNPDGTPQEGVMLPEYAPFYQLNNDFVGWIQIPGTRINYPVMCSASGDEDYYLKHTFKREWSDWGAIYMRKSESDIFAPSDNVILYGHHMKDGSMFTALDKYRDKSFWEEHRYVTFDTLYERHTYEIFAVFRTSGTFGVGYSYNLFKNAADASHYDKFVREVKELSFYDTGITPKYGDKLICLSTCEYTTNNGRLVVVARRIS